MRGELQQLLAAVQAVAAGSGQPPPAVVAAGRVLLGYLSSNALSALQVLEAGLLPLVQGLRGCGVPALAAAAELLLSDASWADAAEEYERGVAQLRLQRAQAAQLEQQWRQAHALEQLQAQAQAQLESLLHQQQVQAQAQLLVQQQAGVQPVPVLNLLVGS